MVVSLSLIPQHKNRYAENSAYRFIPVSAGNVAVAGEYREVSTYNDVYIFIYGLDVAKM